MGATESAAAFACGDGEFKECELLVDGCRGIYAPQAFAQGHGEEWGLSPEDLAVLRAGPDHDLYWETWDDVWAEATLEHGGETWHLHGDCGDIFAVVYHDEEGEDDA